MNPRIQVKLGDTLDKTQTRLAKTQTQHLKKLDSELQIMNENGKLQMLKKLMPMRSRAVLIAFLARKCMRACK
jgi:hypothetical protein